MAQPKSAQEDRKRSGPWFVSPPPNWPVNDVSILREVDDPLGAALLLALYNVRLVAETARERRCHLFAGHVAVSLGDDVPGEIRGPLMLFATLMRLPQDVSDGALAHACRAVAEWAEANSRAITSVGYAEAAAHLLPDDPEMANLAGRACRRAGERQRAELWYERGAGLARRAENPLEHVNGLLGFGNLFRDQGDFGRAFTWIRRAGRTARRGGLRESAGEALHDAFFLSYLQDNLLRAATWAERAAKVYPVHASRFPYFAADLALLLGRNGLYHEAIKLLDAVQVHLQAPVEQLQLCAISAWVSGGARDSQRFSEALVRVKQMADQLPYASAAALAYGAAGAQHLGEWALAEELIAAALARVDNALAARLAARVRADIRARESAVPRPDTSHPGTRNLVTVAEEVHSRVRRWRGPTWRPRKK
jgi:tetratricopeptide (TPR) repeat protein